MLQLDLPGARDVDFHRVDGHTSSSCSRWASPSSSPPFAAVSFDLVQIVISIFALELTIASMLDGALYILCLGRLGACGAHRHRA